MRTNKYLFPKLILYPIRKKYLYLAFVLLLVILILPWISFTTGDGVVTAIDPNERIQTLNTPLTGFIKNWRIKEGQQIKKGEIIAEISDNDPNLLDRYLRAENSANASLKSAILMRDTAKINLDRQQKLFMQGLSSRKDYEKAKIDFSKLEMDLAKAQVELTKAESLASKQSSQVIKAPRDGVITKIMPGELGQMIKKGAPIAIFSPQVNSPAVEVWIDGQDASMLAVGQKARLQLEGWPSLQIAGWPSIAINTFKGRVHLIDQGSSYNGKFRVLITPEGGWPGSSIVRQGNLARAYIQLADSFIFKEIWRKLNNFPAVTGPIKAEIDKLGQLENKKK